ncbi:MAG TPA: FAD-binding oxidoreductase [Candidatus Obscuribacterales bacterium]
MKAIAQTLKTIVGSDKAICEWDNLEAYWQERINQALIPGKASSDIVYPQTQEELAEVMSCAYGNNWGVLPCGNGSKLGWGGLVDGVNLIISSKRLNRMIEHAVGDLTVTVEAGMKFAELQEILAAADQFLALDPAYPESATIGGIIATADAGSWRQRYGGVRDMLLGFSLVRADGQVAKAGGRVVKNVAGYDLMKLFAGSYGTLGMLSQVTLRVYPMQMASGTVVLTGDAEAIATATKTLLASALTPTAVDLLSTQLVASLGIGQGMGLIIRFQSVPESVKQQSARILEVGQQLSLQGVVHTATDEAEIWQKIKQQIWANQSQGRIICKIGVLPSNAVEILTQLDKLTSENGMGLVHAGSGLGLLRFERSQILQELRRSCQNKGGFLTILEAPPTLKQQIDVWGYTGNALDLMRRIKKQFDAKNLLSPHRLVDGI